MPQPTQDELFEQFWRAYPRRTAKADARKAWMKLSPSLELHQQILIAIAWQRQTPQWTKDDGQYQPYPASWIRAERWLDEPIETSSPAKPAEYWWDECQRIHGGLCQKSLTHFTKMRAEKAS